MRVSKWGNSLAVRLPKKIVDKLDLKDGDEINLGVSEGPGAVFDSEGHPRSFEISRAERVEQGIQELRKLRRMMPANFKFNRDEANER